MLMFLLLPLYMSRKGWALSDTGESPRRSQDKGVDGDTSPNVDPTKDVEGGSIWVLDRIVFSVNIWGCQSK